MGAIPQFTTDLVIFTEEIVNGKLHFLCTGKKATAFSLVEYSTIAIYEDNHYLFF